jgi:hypothetical protein
VDCAKEAKAVVIYETLPSAQKAHLAAPAQALRERYEREKGARDLPQVLLEMACLFAGDPSDPLGGLATPLSAGDERMGRAPYWLDAMLTILREYERLPLEERTMLARYAGDQGIALPLEAGAHAERVLAGLARIGLLDRQGLMDFYRGLSAEEGRQLARDTIEIWESNLDEEEEVKEAVDEAVLALACLVPGSLQDFHLELIDTYIAGSHAIYWNVDAETRDEMIRIVETDRSLRYFVIGCLAWTYDDVVRAAMHRWRHSPPDSDEYFAQEVETALREAGWELTETGESRFFYATECYRLVPVAEAPVADVPGPVDVTTPHEESCPWCGEQLVNLFDMDFQDPRLAFLAPGWSRLRILMCGRCTCFDTVYSGVDPQGACRWSDLNVHPGFIGNENQGYTYPPRRLVLGPPRRTPLESHLPWGWMEPGASQIGGFPRWIENVKPSVCPRCQKTMSFVGQLLTEDVLGDAYEGMTYAFLCQECRLAATFYDQT